MGRFSTFLHIGALALLAACGGTSDEKAAGSARAVGTGADTAFKVALLTPGPISDQSWNGGAYEGLMRIRDSMGARVSHIQTRTPAEFEENFRQYGAQGYTLVFGHGFEFQDAARRVAPSFPKTIYVTTSSDQAGPNLAGMRFAFEEPSYLAGMLAGAMTKTNVVGAIGGTELPPVKTSFTAFAAGAQAVNPRVRVLTSFLGNWDDLSAGREQALAQIGQGADVIFQNADAAGLGVFQAARESRGVYAIGSNSDQNGVAPTVTLASVVIDLPRAFLYVAREVRDSAFTPRAISLGESTEVVKLVINPALAERIPPAARVAIDSVERRMKAGTFSAPGVQSAFDGDSP